MDEAERNKIFALGGADAYRAFDGTLRVLLEMPLERRGEWIDQQIDERLYEAKVAEGEGNKAYAERSHQRVSALYTLRTLIGGRA